MKIADNHIHLSPSGQCTGCSACASICPTDSITMCADKEGFLQPHINTESCIKCHKCEKSCPVLAAPVISADFEAQVFAVINKNDEIRMHSSSGGVFYALAEWVIKQGGVVFGAKFDTGWDVVHDYSETIEGLKPFMRSKYVQSSIDETFKQVKHFLELNRYVLFSGTPCQIGGLNAFLNKKYSNLLTVDFICHGVPSPKVWRKYLLWKAKGDKVLDVNFRDKREGWKDFQCVTTTTTTTRERQRENIYFRGFLENIYLRRSCYNCQFKQAHRISDITLADYWGIQDFCPDMDDNKGTSAVFVHTAKGEQILQHLSNILMLKEQNIDDVMAYNTMLTRSVPYTTRRNRFFFYFPWLPFGKLGFAIDKDWVCKRVYKKLKAILKRILMR